MAQLHIAVSDRLCLVAAPTLLKQWMHTCAGAGHLFDHNAQKVSSISPEWLDGKVCVVCIDDYAQENLSTADSCPLLESLKQASANAKILAVTRNQDPKTRQLIYRSGASEILLTPFQVEEFMWRIQRIKLQHYSELQIDGWRICTDTAQAHHAAKGLQEHLTPAELSILVKLWNAQGNVVLRADLIDEIAVRSSDSRSLNTLVLRLRKKLEKDPENPKIILTVPKRGYRLGVDS